MIEDWQPPPTLDGKTPEVPPGLSNGKIVEGDFPLDQVVIDTFPPGTEVRSCNLYATSSEWTVIAKIEAKLAEHDETRFYFLKASNHYGRAMLEGEFHSMTELYKVIPELVPKPHAWGQLSVSHPKTYYFLCDFIDMTNQAPDPVQLCSKLVALHRTSKSPTDMFGFHVTPLRGNLPLQTTWNPSWQDFFVQLLLGTLKLDQKINGTWKDLGQLVEWLIAHVVPQVLGPLEADGRTVKPALIHGGNIGTDSKTGEVRIFDASSYYAHNEMEVAIWRAVPNTLVGSGVYLKEYIAQMGVSEPAEQFDDRHKLYSACTALHAAACHNLDRFREESHAKIKYLIDKYAPMPENASDDAPTIW
ncbi:hypothetical protein CONLIGDRAFT_718125 [Coniochaeta ligniaria NRRL 30616]|uniref:protein-ribulosamine 3-kinase n=1 Tax=Coniochaeta ligniaria NRRL 30616 TaxID=1408157 RepID=A0A1J7IC30_9PEZI|nr:hypothetical protein CONLIGDRAFT_718125 [Coniochaeta ligniaria NRRL 30616]